LQKKLNKKVNIIKEKSIQEITNERNKAKKNGQQSLAKKLNDFLVNKSKESYHNSISNQVKNEKLKINKNKNYILNKLEEPNNYNLLYKLINGLFNEKLSIKSKEGFQKYLEDLKQREEQLKIEEYELKNKQNKQEIQENKQKNIDERVEIMKKKEEIIKKKEEIIKKKEDIMKILKSVYRLKYNKSIENKKENIIKELNSGINKKNRNKFLSEIKNISSHIDLATGFHNFTQIEYYICNIEQINQICKKQNIELSRQILIDFSPLYYFNGIFYFNPNCKIIWEKTKDKLLQKNQNNEDNFDDNIEGNIEMTEINKIDELIIKVDEFNKKNSIFSKIFEKKILGKATEKEINKSNKKNTEYINTTNFYTLCEELGNAVDTMVIIDNNIIKSTITKSQTNSIILTDDNHIFRLKKTNLNGIQNGGMTIFLEVITLLALTVGLFVSISAVSCAFNNEKVLYNNYEREKEYKQNKNGIYLYDYYQCVKVRTFSLILKTIETIFNFPLFIFIKVVHLFKSHMVDKRRIIKDTILKDNIIISNFYIDIKSVIGHESTEKIEYLDFLKRMPIKTNFKLYKDKFKIFFVCNCTINKIELDKIYFKTDRPFKIDYFGDNIYFFRNFDEDYMYEKKEKNLANLQKIIGNREKIEIGNIIGNRMRIKRRKEGKENIIEKKDRKKKLANLRKNINNREKIIEGIEKNIEEIERKENTIEEIERKENTIEEIERKENTIEKIERIEKIIEEIERIEKIIEEIQGKENTRDKRERKKEEIKKFIEEYIKKYMVENLKLPSGIYYKNKNNLSYLTSNETLNTLVNDKRFNLLKTKKKFFLEKQIRGIINKLYKII
jgi:hypothetical protein